MMKKTDEFNKLNIEKSPTNISESIINNETSESISTSRESIESSSLESEVNLDLSKLNEYITTFKQMVYSNDWMRKRKEIQEVISNIESQFSALYKEKKKEYIKENGNDLEFYFDPVYKKDFSHTLKEYKSKKSAYYISQEKIQKENFKKSLQIIERIKTLIQTGENSSNCYKEFKELQEQWHQIGHTLPRAESNNIWQTYRHHVERFYDFIHLNRELRDKSFKHNYKEKLKLIERAEKLIENPDVIASIRELNSLHRQWKNDLGPVSREHREELWSRFQIITSKIHKQKDEYDANNEVILQENLKKKEEILANIEALYTNPPNNHNAWQSTFKKINEYKEAFYNIGRIPKSQNKITWDKFKVILKEFNSQKNQFYKKHKSEEKANIKEKKRLISEVLNILESPDWHLYLERIKTIQSEWKKTKRVSRKISNQLWEEFKKNTDLYFHKLKNKGKTYSEKDQKIIEAKNKYLDDLKKQKVSVETDDLLTYIELAYNHWTSIGSTANEDKLHKEFTTFLLSLWEQTKLKRVDKENALFKTNLLFLKSNPEELNKKSFILNKKVNESKAELIQLQNNLSFFNSNSNENPLVEEVNVKISLLTEKIEKWKMKLKELRILSQRLDNNT